MTYVFKNNQFLKSKHFPKILFSLQDYFYIVLL